MKIETKDIVYWILMAIIYFAGVSRNIFSGKRRELSEIVNKYSEALNKNENSMDAAQYPYHLLNAGILTLNNKEIKRVLKLIEKRHLENPFQARENIDYKNIRNKLVELQEHGNYNW